MTHTLETTAIARGVARALRLNEDLVEAIGLGPRHGPSAVRPCGRGRARRARSRQRFGRRFRHNEQSLRIAETLNLTEEVRDGILTHTGPQEPATLEGKIVRIVDRVAYINHDIDDAVRFGILDPAELPQEEVALLGDRGSDADRHARPRSRRELRSGRATSCRATEIGRAMLALREFMFERVYLGPHARLEQERARGTVRRDLRRTSLERGEEPSRSSTSSQA